MDFLLNLSNNIDYTILVTVIVVFILSFIHKIDLVAENLSKLFMIISIIALILMTVIVSYDVIARKLWHGGSIAMQELEWHLFDITFLFSIAYTLAKDKHVRVDIFYDKFPKKVKAIIQIVTILFFVIPLSTLVVTEAIPFVQMSYSMHEQSGDPGGLCCRWIIKSAMIWAFIIVIMQSIAELKKAYYKLRHSK